MYFGWFEIMLHPTEESERLVWEHSTGTPFDQRETNSKLMKRAGSKQIVENYTTE